jgi:hypothetical protein
VKLFIASLSTSSLTFFRFAAATLSDFVPEMLVELDTGVQGYTSQFNEGTCQFQYIYIYRVSDIHLLSFRLSGLLTMFRWLLFIHLLLSINIYLWSTFKNPIFIYRKMIAFCALIIPVSLYAWGLTPGEG